MNKRTVPVARSVVVVASLNIGIGRYTTLTTRHELENDRSQIEDRECQLEIHILLQSYSRLLVSDTCYCMFAVLLFHVDPLPRSLDRC